MSKRKRALGVGAVGLFCTALLGCGGQSEPSRGHGDRGTEGAPPPGSGWPQSTTPGLGWSVRDTTPHAWGLNARAVIDTTEDRFMVFSGGARDVWALSLSGDRQATWSQVIPEDDAWPTTAPFSGVYDAAQHRLLLLVDQLDGGSIDYDAVELWALSLGASPRFERLATQGARPGRELASARLALDPDGQRLFAMGGALDTCGTWSLALDTLTWSRLADGPAEFGLCAYTARAGGDLFFDSERARLLAFSEVGEWQLRLDDTTWTPLPPPPCYGAPTPAFDERRRLLIFPTNGCGASSVYWLDGDVWSSSAAIDLGSPLAVDVARDRVIYLLNPSNATQQINLDTLRRSELTPDTRGELLNEGSTAVWDPLHQRAVAFGGEADATGKAQTMIYEGSSANGWRKLDARATPQSWRGGGVYDPQAQSVVALDARDGGLILRTLTDSSKPTWEERVVPPGPSERTHSLVVYDTHDEQLLVVGGQQDAAHDSPELHEVWALGSGSDAAWRQLSLSGPGPAAYWPQQGIYDAPRRRLVVLSSLAPGEDGLPRLSVHALTPSGDSATWQLLEPLGKAPVSTMQVVLDEAGQRLIAVDTGGWGPLVAALELAKDPPVWHTFCDRGTPPPEWFGSLALSVLDDGLFVAVQNGAFRFDLATPYCD